MEEHEHERYQPDPTPVTAARILREVSSLESLLDEKIANVRAQVDALTKAQDVFRADITRVPTAVDKAVSGLKELHEAMFSERLKALNEKTEERFQTMQEKFESISIQFALRDDRVKQAALDTKNELASALVAQDRLGSKQNESTLEATRKSEENFGKQIEQQRQLLEVRTSALDGKIEALKDMVLRGEGKDTGRSVSQGTAFAIIGALLGIASLIIVLLKL